MASTLVPWIAKHDRSVACFLGDWIGWVLWLHWCSISNWCVLRVALLLGNDRGVADASPLRRSEPIGLRRCLRRTLCAGGLRWHVGRCRCNGKGWTPNRCNHWSTGKGMNQWRCHDQPGRGCHLPSLWKQRITSRWCFPKIDTWPGPWMWSWERKRRHSNWSKSFNCFNQLVKEFDSRSFNNFQS